MQTNDPVSNFFTFLEARRVGIFVLLWVLVVAVFLLQWLVWIFARGRFKRPWAARALGAGTGTGTGTGTGGTTSARPIYYVFSEAIVKIIDDFRHLLALIIIVIFAIALIFVLIQASPSIDAMKEALTAVTGTLGGLVGSIIGYYFGESSVTKAVGSDGGGAGGVGGGGTAGAAVQDTPAESKGGTKADDIKIAPSPPGAKPSGEAAPNSGEGKGEAEPMGVVDEGDTDDEASG